MGQRVLKRRHPCNHRVHDPCPVALGEGLPRFSKALGVDLIITPEGVPVLVELQHGFGRRGLLKLFPAANRTYRRRFRSLLREHGTCFEIQAGLRFLCSDKIRTYKHFARYQPPSLPFHGWDESVERWLETLEAEVVLAKPPTGSCGKGIRVYRRSELLTSGAARRLTSPTLLQALAECRPLLDDQQRPHVGCIRHIVVMVSDGAQLSFLHLPSYWRVSPVPRSVVSAPPDRDELTANISRGAFPLAVGDDEEVTVRKMTEEICAEVISVITGTSGCPLGASVAIEDDGAICGDSPTEVIGAAAV